MHVPRNRSRLPFLIISTRALLSTLFGGPSPVRADSFVTFAAYDGVINPVAAEYLHDTIVVAREREAEAVIIRLNTPGGLDPSMRLILSPWAGAKWTR